MKLRLATDVYKTVAAGFFPVQCAVLPNPIFPSFHVTVVIQDSCLRDKFILRIFSDFLLSPFLSGIQ